MRARLERVPHYLAHLSAARTILWCYLLWWAVVVAHHFEASPRLWLTSIGLSLIIGFALVLNAGSGGSRLGFWPRFRFFLAPFCVSSFSALVKGKGFLLILSPVPSEVAWGLAACAAFLVVVGLARRAYDALPL